MISGALFSARRSRMARERRTRAEWQKIVRRWRASGVSAASFAARHGLSPHTLQWWASTLGVIAVDEKKVALVPVEITPDIVRSGGVVELELGGLRMRVDVGSDPRYV